MKLFKQSLVFGVAFEFMLFVVMVIAFQNSHGCVPNWLGYAVMAVHYPAMWLADHFILPPFNLVIAVVFATAVWTSLAFITLCLRQRWRK